MDLIKESLAEQLKFSPEKYTDKGTDNTIIKNETAKKKSEEKKKPIRTKRQSRVLGFRAQQQATRDIIEELDDGEGNPVYKFLRINALRFKVIAEAMISVPIEFVFHFFVMIGPMITLASVGFIWVLVWMSVEEIAFHAKYFETIIVISPNEAKC